MKDSGFHRNPVRQHRHTSLAMSYCPLGKIRHNPDARCSVELAHKDVDTGQFRPGIHRAIFGAV